MNANAKHLTYNETNLHWKKYQKFFPDELQIKEHNMPTEEWWKWNERDIFQSSNPV